MFQKALIAEDFDSNNRSLAKLLRKNLKIPTVVSTFYCDDALKKSQKALLVDNDPFELLITDLNFLEDHRTKKLTNGRELVGALKKLQPNLKTIIFSMENRPSTIKQIITTYNIDSYIVKGPCDLEELEKAIQHIAMGESYFSRELQMSLKSDDLLVLSSYDNMILEYLSKGYTQKETATLFQQKNIKPSSLSSIEKRINTLFETFNARNIPHLISLLKDLGLI